MLKKQRGAVSKRLEQCQRSREELLVRKEPARSMQQRNRRRIEAATLERIQPKKRIFFSKYISLSIIMYSHYSLSFFLFLIIFISKDVFIISISTDVAKKAIR